jgi:hypothetical protein
MIAAAIEKNRPPRGWHMSHVELPRPLEDYFAHAELEGGPHLRRFTITLPYFAGDRLDRIQWWWSVTHAQQRMGGPEGLEPWRREAVVRFRQHIEHWLKNNGLALSGNEPIPRLHEAPAIPSLEALPRQVRA